MGILMDILKFIWYYLLVIFPFGAAIFMGVTTSYMVKAHFYDKQKYNILRELQWLSFGEEKVKGKIEKQISHDTATMVVCVILLFVYFYYVGESSTLVNVYLFITYLVGFGGDSVKDKNNMEEFLKQYDINIRLEELQNGTGYYRK